MEFKEVFNELRDMFINKNVANIPNVAFQFNITGEGNGTFYAEVKDGKLSIEPYDYHDNDAILEAKYKTFKKIIAGELNPVTAFFTGRLKVTGDLGKAAILENILK